jgi:hypothetical protein
MTVYDPKTGQMSEFTPEERAARAAEVKRKAKQKRREGSGQAPD